MDDEILDGFICPITFAIMEDPYSTIDGHTFEKNAIEVWLKKNDTNPVTNKKLESKQLIPNIALKKAIDEFKMRVLENNQFKIQCEQRIKNLEDEKKIDKKFTAMLEGKLSEISDLNDELKENNKKINDTNHSLEKIIEVLNEEKKSLLEKIEQHSVSLAETNSNQQKLSEKEKWLKIAKANPDQFLKQIETDLKVVEYFVSHVEFHNLAVSNFETYEKIVQFHPNLPQDLEDRLAKLYSEKAESLINTSQSKHEDIYVSVIPAAVSYEHFSNFLIMWLEKNNHSQKAEIILISTSQHSSARKRFVDSGVDSSFLVDYLKANKNNDVGLDKDFIFKLLIDSLLQQLFNKCRKIVENELSLLNNNAPSYRTSSFFVSPNKKEDIEFLDELLLHLFDIATGKSASDIIEEVRKPFKNKLSSGIEMILKNIIQEESSINNQIAEIKPLLKSDLGLRKS